MEKETKIVSIGSLKQSRALTPKNEKFQCKHRNVIVDAEKREIECSVCGEVINPFDYIFNIALKEEKYFEQYMYYKKESETLISQRNKLIDEIRNLNAKKRRIA